MAPSPRAARQRFRVWIVRYADWEPCDPHQRPPSAVALEPAEEGTMTRRQARAYTEAFNRAALGAGRRLWALSVPVTLHYRGEPRPGQIIR